MGDGALRNRVCHCGSGRKYKKCCFQKDAVPRIFGSTFRVSEDVFVTGLEVSIDGRLRLLSEDRVIDLKDATAAEWRRKSGGELARVSEISIEGNELDSVEAVLRRYDFVFGIDTNQAIVRGVKYNIACLTCATRSVSADGYEGTIQSIQALDFCDVGVPAERVGWLFAIRVVMSGGLKDHHRVLVCTDHDVKAHIEINKRGQPIISDYMLPPNFHIMYARDRGSSIPNKVVAAADKGAANIIKKLLSGAEAPPQLVLSSLLCQAPVRGLRVWHSEAFTKYYDPAK